MAKADGVARIIALAALGKNGGGSIGGTTNYLDLINKPKINNVELTGNKTLEDLGISGGTDANAVYTYYASYSDDNWFTEEAVAAILQAVKDNGYSNFELCTLNGSHYTLTKGGNLQALTATDEAFELLSPQNNLENHINYTFNAHLNENNRVVVSGLVKTVHTAEEMFGTYLPRTLEKMPGYDGTREHLILQANAGNLEWDSSLDGGIFGDSYTDPTYYTEKQVDKIVTDTVNEALGGRY